MTWTETPPMNLTRITLACVEPTWTMKTVVFVFFLWQARSDARRESLFFSLVNHSFSLFRFLMNAGLELTCLVSGVCESAVHAAWVKHSLTSTPTSSESVWWGEAPLQPSVSFPSKKPAHFQESNGLKVEESPSPRKVCERECVCPFRTWGGLSLWDGRGGERSGQTGRSALLMGFNNRAGKQAAETRDTESDRVGQEAARGRLRIKSPKPVAPEEV